MESIRRRDFLAMLMASGVSAHARSLDTDSWLYREEEKKGFSILQGFTNEVSAQFSLLLPKRGVWSIEITENGHSELLELQQEIHSREFSDLCVHKITVSNLRLGRNYILSVRNTEGFVVDQREFSALDLSSRQTRLAFLSCALDLLHRDDVWLQLETQKPELIFFLGDNVYADRLSWIRKKIADGKQLWDRYVETRQRVAFYFQRRLTPVVAIWDDHDFGGNNLGRSYPHKQESVRVFETFFAQSESQGLSRGPGIARQFSAFGADFYLLDGRYFRDDSRVSGAKMFGSLQEKWLFSQIRPRASFLLNGSMFFGGYTQKDSFEGQFDDDFNNFLMRLRASDGLFCFAGGDVHFSEVQSIEAAQLGYPTFELTSSSIHSMTFPGHEHRWTNSRRKASTSSHNFCIFDGCFSDDRIEGEISSFSARGAEFKVGVVAAR